MYSKEGCEMAQRVKALAAKPRSLNLVPWDTVGGENRFLQVVPWPSQYNVVPPTVFVLETKFLFLKMLPLSCSTTKLICSHRITYKTHLQKHGRLPLSHLSLKATCRSPTNTCHRKHFPTARPPVSHSAGLECPSETRLFFSPARWLSE